MKTVIFYNKTEIAELKQIKDIEDKKTRIEALKSFCKKHNRSIGGAAHKMSKLSKRGRSKRNITEGIISKNELRIPIKNVVIENNYLIVKF